MNQTYYFLGMNRKRYYQQFFQTLGLLFRSLQIELIIQSHEASARNEISYYLNAK